MERKCHAIIILGILYNNSIVDRKFSGKKGERKYQGKGRKTIEGKGNKIQWTGKRGRNKGERERREGG